MQIPDKLTRIDMQDIDDVLGLSPMQEGMLFHYLKEPESDYYFEQLCLHISGEIDLQFFEQAWNMIIKANEMLRTVFRWEKLEKPLQAILKKHKIKLHYYDFSNIHGSISQEIERLKRNDRIEKFDLHQVPFRVTLCKIEYCSYELIISNHHIIYDGWSNGIILKELLDVYNGLAQNRIPNLAVKTKYKEFIHRFHHQNNEEKNDEINYWKNYLHGLETPPMLSIKKIAVKNAINNTSAAHHKTVLDTDTYIELDNYLKKSKITAAALLYSAWGILLQKYNNVDDTVFGTTVSGRNIPLKGIAEMVGLFINTLPMRIQMEIEPQTGETVHQFLSRINHELLVREKYETSSLVDIKKYGDIEGNNELFDTLMVIENYPLDRRLKEQNSELVIDSYAIFERTHYDLTVAVTLPIAKEEITIDIYYRDEFFENDAIQRLALHYKTVIKNLLNNACLAVKAIEILTVTEKQELLFDFNHTGPDYPGDKTIPQLFTGQVEKSPDNMALVGVTSVETLRATSLQYQYQYQYQITYSQLNEKSDLLKEVLIEKGILPDTIVGIMMERSVDLIIGILGILQAGAAYLPINPNYPDERINYMLKDSGAKLLAVANDKEGEKLRSWEGEKIFLESIIHNSNPLKGRPRRGLQHSNLAYVIYTSGSTGQPKGVPITYANLSPLLHWGYQSLRITPYDRTVQNLSYFFDWSVWEIFITLTAGAGLYMVSGDVILDAGRYLDFIYRHAITVLHITPTHFQSLLHVSPGKRLHTLKYLCIGAEKLNYDLVEQSYLWLSENCRVFNMYGPTEVTIMSAVLEIDKSGLALYKKLSSVPIGKNLGNNSLFILDRYMHPSPISVPGELYIGGAGVAGGYLNNPELAAEKFNRSYRSNRTNILYKTGDFARWLPDGTVEFLGRSDHQLKIRGVRIEPGEIENRLLEHYAVKEALIIAKEHNGEKFLCAYIVPSLHDAQENLAGTLKEFLSLRLPAYMIPAYFIVIAQMPLNPNGKVNLKVLPDPVLKPSKEYAGPRDDREKFLVMIWARVLGIDPSGIGIDDDFFELGGHSLNVMALLGCIHKELYIEVPFKEFFTGPTIRQLAMYISRKEIKKYEEIPPIEEMEYYPLSPIQKGLFVLQQMDTGCTAYNIHGMMTITGPVDGKKLERIFKQLIARHESLRTSFQNIAGEPVQRIHHDVEFEIEQISTAENFIRPFDLSLAPLIRVGLKNEAAENYLLILDMHHIIADGMSVNILINDFQAFYKDEKIPALRMQYKDFSEWQNHNRETDKLKKQENFWLNEFAGEIPVLNLPVDYGRPLTKNFEGVSLTFEISAGQTRALKNLANETKTTLFMVLLTIYNIFLAKLSGQEDIIIGTPTAGRRYPGLEGIIGMFVNTLTLRNFPHAQKTVAQFLLEIKNRTLQAFENQDYLYDNLVENINLSRDNSRNPLFDVMFALQDQETANITVRDLNITRCAYTAYTENTSKFDLSLIAVEKEGRLFFTVEYAAKLFKKNTIERFISYFKNIVSSVLSGTREKIAKIEIITGDELKQVYEVFNHPLVEYEQKNVMELFTDQVNKNPHSIACFDRGNYLTYEELDNRAEVLAEIIKEI